jgi:transcriptional regulator with GAF, ATPase, and Fis domain
MGDGPHLRTQHEHERGHHEPGDRDTPRGTLDTAVASALREVPGADAVAISLFPRMGRVRTPAATSKLAMVGDMLQYGLQQGPCLDALWETPVVHSADLAEESRWPAWAARMAGEYEARSVVCLRLLVRVDMLAALTVYARAPHAFDARSLERAQRLADDLAAAVGAAVRRSEPT